MMDDALKDKLKQKIVETVLYMSKTEEDRKASTGAFNEAIKGAKHRIEAMANAVNTGDIACLFDAYNETEVEILVRGA